jgi:hypothetical protein
MAVNAYVYVHKRLDTGQLFYVGKGSGNRATSKKDRNPHWQNIVAKAGYESIIIASGLSHKQALNAEKLAIAALKKFYPLVNLTEGGDGGNGLKGSKHPLFGKQRSAQTKAKISASLQGVSAGGKAKKGIALSATHKQAISNGLKGKPKSAEHVASVSAANRATTKNKQPRKPLSDATREKISLAQIGKTKVMKPRAIYVTPLGNFGTLREAAKAHNVKSIQNRFHGWSHGKYSYPPMDGYLIKKIGG